MTCDGEYFYLKVNFILGFLKLIKTIFFFQLNCTSFISYSCPCFRDHWLMKKLVWKLNKLLKKLFKATHFAAPLIFSLKNQSF